LLYATNVEFNEHGKLSGWRKKIYVMSVTYSIFTSTTVGYNKANYYHTLAVKIKLPV